MSDWNATDYSFLAAALGSFKADAESTKDSIRRGGRERNSLLGEKPTDTEIDRYFTGAGALTAGAAALMDKKWRRIGLGALTGFESGVVMDNKGSGKGPHESMTPWTMAALGALLGYSLPDDLAVSLSASEDKKTGKEVKIGVEKKF